MNSYDVTLTGITPLLLHRDNIEFADQLARWREDPSNKKLSKAGDDRTPAFTWLGHCPARRASAGLGRAWHG